MSSGPSAEGPLGVITQRLQEWRSGNSRALAELTQAMYSELHRLASVMLFRRTKGEPLDPAELVHNLYFRLPDAQKMDWQSRGHFLGVAAKIMRNLLVDQARRRSSAKRGGGVPITLAEPGSTDPGLRVDVLRVHQALERFAENYPRQARVLELRFFGGLSTDEVTEALNAEGGDSSPRTVERDWSFARAWLERRLSQ